MRDLIVLQLSDIIFKIWYVEKKIMILCCVELGGTTELSEVLCDVSNGHFAVILLVTMLGGLCLINYGE